MRKLFSSIYLIVGLLLFMLGLLMLLGQTGVVGFFSAIFPDTQTFEVAGAVFQFLGGFLVIYGTVKLAASEFRVKNDGENQAMLLGLSRAVDRVEKRTTEVWEKLSPIQSANNKFQSPTSGNLSCRFCGAKIEQESSFCSNCGKSQK